MTDQGQQSAANPPPPTAAPATLLPTERFGVRSNLADQAILIYGRNKIGKSTFAAEFDQALFLATEPGLAGLSVFQAPPDGSGITSWHQFLTIVAEIAQGSHPFRTIIVDTVDAMWRLCVEHVCGTRQVEHLDDLGGYGKGYSLAGNEFERVIRKMLHLPYGTVFVSHDKEVELKNKAGIVHTKTVPTMPGTPSRILLDFVDQILFFDIALDTDGTERRVIRCRPSANYDAGDRQCVLPAELPLDYQTFADAFAAGMAEKLSAAAPTS